MSRFNPSLHPRNLLGEFTGVGGSDKRLKKIHKTRGKLDKAQQDFLRTASVRTVGGGRRALTTTEARRFLNDPNVHAKRIQGTGRQRRAAARVLTAKQAHLRNFGRKVQTPTPRRRRR